MSLDYKSNHPNLRASGYLWEPADSGDSGDSLLISAKWLAQALRF